MHTTREDTYNIKLYILLPLVLTAYERDKKLAQETFKTPDPYIRMIDEAMLRVEKDLKEVRQYMRKNGIKVYEQRRTDKELEAKYMHRGYHADMDLMWSVVRSSCRILMEKYLGMDVSKYKNLAVPMELQEYDI